MQSRYRDQRDAKVGTLLHVKTQCESFINPSPRMALQWYIYGSARPGQNAGTMARIVKQTNTGL